MDSGETGREFAGGAIGEAVDGRRQSARLSPDGGALRAVASDGSVHEIGYRGMTLEIGGASGRMVFCRGPDRAVTLFSETPGFLEALRDAARGLLDEPIDRLLAGRRRTRRRTLLAAAIVLVVLAGLVLGARLLVGWSVATFLPFDVDRQIGRAASSSMAKPGPVISRPAVDEALLALIDRLRPHAAVPDVEFRVEVVRNDEVNAYALPGGYLTVFSGLILDALAPEEVAGVLAHEMAHVTLRHGMQRMVQSAAVLVAVSAFFGDATGLAAMAVDFFTWQTINSYSRGSEEEADAEAVRMLLAARLDPRGLVEFLERLDARDGKVGDVLSWLGTHPSCRDRIAAIEARIAAEGPAQSTGTGIDWEAVRAALRGP